MSTLRSYNDPDQQTQNTPSSFMTAQNKNEVHCGMCGKSIYIDEETLVFVRDAIESGLDDPFRCEACQEEYDDLAYEG